MYYLHANYLFICIDMNVLLGLLLILTLYSYVPGDDEVKETKHMQAVKDFLSSNAQGEKNCFTLYSFKTITHTMQLY